MQSAGRDDSFWKEEVSFPPLLFYFSRAHLHPVLIPNTTAFSPSLSLSLCALCVFSIVLRTWKIERVNASLMRVSNIFSENFSRPRQRENIFEWEGRITGLREYLFIIIYRVFYATSSKMV